MPITSERHVDQRTTKRVQMCKIKQSACSRKEGAVASTREVTAFCLLALSRDIFINAAQRR